MARSASYKVKFRRRRDGLTDYYLRTKLLRSGLPRVVVRISNKHVKVLIVSSKPIGDFTVASAFSQELKRFDWPFSCNNTPASYLTAYLAGLRCLKKGVSEGILDIGLHKPVKGGRIYAACKGLLDAGFKVRVDESLLPDKSRILGEHIVNYFKASGGRGFSGYLSRGLNVEEMPETFEKVKTRIKEAVEK
ncbi:MAG: 50S ribosomal protein L18 [Crenarchaeota archaeon]|nr:50S ribosomal protein L18 [Thermoproteota archaeon]MDW8033925.1 50S ribosomal protein L18 [Nitrososphaerota archaeon]